MTATIDGRRYDTETAVEIISADGGDGRGDFHWFEEVLCRTQKGAWFLAGRGNAASKYARAEGNGRGPGSGIIPLTPAEAQAYLERQQATALLDQYFSESIEIA